MVLSHKLHAEGSIETVGAGIRLGAQDAHPVGAGRTGPMGCLPHQPVTHATATVSLHDFERMNHGDPIMHRAKGSAGGFVVDAAKETGLRLLDALHDGKALGADPALGPDVAHD